MMTAILMTVVTLKMQPVSQSELFLYNSTTLNNKAKHKVVNTISHICIATNEATIKSGVAVGAHLVPILFIAVQPHKAFMYRFKVGDLMN